MSTSTPPEWRLSRRWPERDKGKFVVEIELGKVPDDIGEGWHLGAVKVCVSSQTRAVTTTVLRGVHVWSLEREVIETQVKGAHNRDRSTPPLAYTFPPEEIPAFLKRRDAHYAELETHLRLDEAAERKTGRPRSVTPDFLREVAQVFLTAKATGDAEPRTAVAHHFGAPPSTAGRWITKARDAGLIPASGRARKQKETKS
jgi:hypothetical protein